LTVACSILIWLAGCGLTDLQRAADAGDRLGQVRAAPPPAVPEDCRITTRAGVVPGERLDLALLRYDAALGAANARLRRCVGWWDQVAGR